jgi:hypothetical protein
LSSPAEPIIVKRKRGRPRSEVPKTALVAWVPTAYHQRLKRIATARDVSVSALLCTVLDKALTPPKKPS